MNQFSLIAIFSFAVIAVNAQDTCLMQTCCEYDCCGPSTSWDPETGSCVLDAENAEGFLQHDDDFELECRKQTCCEDACCAPGTIYNGDCCQNSNVPVFIVKARYEVGPVQNCPIGLVNLGTLVFNSQFGIESMSFPMGDCDNPVAVGDGYICPDSLTEVITGFSQVPPGPDSATLETSFRFLNVTETFESVLCDFELTVTFEILCGVVNFAALPEGCNVEEKEVPTCVCQLNCTGDDCVANLALQVDSAIQTQDFGLCAAPGFAQKMGMTF